ncbi:MAG: sulfite exporter TauE/SafE family protein [Alphaproteobacteria bacterium]|nr:sulfite exporter TauE/SafE family protein [Alphaproteobacteria bacterium]
MQIYLPIAELSVNVWLILAMGGAVGFVTGMFGVGGGFLMTPFLIFAGIPPIVSVATGASQIVASSVSGVATQVARKGVDFTMGLVLVGGGIPGAIVGVYIVSLLADTGQVDLVIKLAYVGLLGTIGSLMLSESVRTLLRRRKAPASRPKRGEHYWLHGLPLKVRFRVSKLYISAIPPVVLGMISGVLSGVMGIGGGFIMVPAMIYILRMPASTVVGTSLFQVFCIATLTTFLHAWVNQTVDIVLALLLMLGGVVGTQYGARVGARLPSEQLRLLISMLIVAMALRLGWEMVSTPADIFSVEPAEDAQ